MRLVAAALFALLTFLGAADSLALAKEPAALPDREVVFAGKSLKLAWQSENPELPVEEFIPADQTLEKWTTLASIRRFPDLDDAKGLAATTLETVSESYPGAPTNMVEKPDADEAIIEFVVESPAKTPAESFVEYNLFKYAKDPKAGPKGGVVAQQYALRTYGDKAEFLKHLKAIRQGLLDEMAATGLQEKPSRNARPVASDWSLKRPVQRAKRVSQSRERRRLESVAPPTMAIPALSSDEGSGTGERSR